MPPVTRIRGHHGGNHYFQLILDTLLAFESLLAVEAGNFFCETPFADGVHHGA